MNFAVGAILKNEDEYLLEWLAFHKVIGFSHFLIADNDSSDATYHILQTLAKNGEPITVIQYPDAPDRRPQLGAYAKLVTICPDEVDAVAFIDADEFVMPTGEAMSVVEAFTERFSDPEVGGVAINWACFGSAEQLFKEEGLVIERFRKRAKANFSVNHHYKVMVRPAAVSSWASPHHANLAKGKYVDMLGRDLIAHEKFANSLSRDVTWDGVRLNHYVVKSLEEFLVRKSPKGSASKDGRVKHRQYFERHDVNEIVANEMMAYVPAVQNEIQRLEAIVSNAAPPQDASPASPLRTLASGIKSALARH